MQKSFNNRQSLICNLFLFLSILYSLIVNPNLVFAHSLGQPPYFKVNGQFSKLYPAPATSLETFPLPQDLATGTYVVNQPITFEFDQSQLPVPPEVVAKTKFYWDFGDGSTGTGLKNVHTYTKPGSYFNVIQAEADGSPKQIIQSTLINVLPSASYKLPQSAIKVNGATSKDSLTDPLRFGFGTDFTLDGSGSTAPSSQIVSYFWDLGDHTSATGATVTHQYDKASYNAIVVLRVKDANGLINDSYVELVNDQDNPVKQASRAVSKVVDKGDTIGPKLIIGGVVLFAIALGLLFWQKRKKKR